MHYWPSEAAAADSSVALAYFSRSIAVVDERRVRRHVEVQTERLASDTLEDGQDVVTGGFELGGRIVRLWASKSHMTQMKGKEAKQTDDTKMPFLASPSASTGTTRSTTLTNFSKTGPMVW